MNTYASQVSHIHVEEKNHQKYCISGSHDSHNPIRYGSSTKQSKEARQRYEVFNTE
jgi:hypothetical protein